MDGARDIVEHVLQAPDSTTGYARVRDVVDMVNAWCSHVLDPEGRGSTTPASSRAYTVLFGCAYQDMLAGDSIGAVTDDEEVLKDHDLVTEAALRRTRQAQMLERIMHELDVRIGGCADEVVAAALRDCRDSVREARQQISLYKSVVECDVASLDRDLISEEPSENQPHTRAGSRSLVELHAVKIQQHMFMHDLRRLVVLDYVPEEFTTTSAAKRPRRMTSVEAVGGIYQRAVMTAQPRQAWFDAVQRRPIGPRIAEEVVPISLMLAEFLGREPLPLDAPHDALVRAHAEVIDCMRGDRVRDDTFRRIEDTWTQAFFRGDVVVATVSQDVDGRVAHCDSSFCRVRQLPPGPGREPRDGPSPGAVPYGTPSGKDPHTAAQPSQFRLVLDPLPAPVRTCAFQHYASTETFARNYFSPDRDPAAAAHALRPEVVKGIRDFLDDRAWPETLDLHPNRHVSVYNDGVLVADPALEEVPTFYAHHSHVFASGGRYRDLTTTHFYPDVAFRPEAYHAMIAAALPPLRVPRTDFLASRPGAAAGAWPDPVPCCGCCGLAREECVAINQRLVAAGRHHCLVREAAEWARQLPGNARVAVSDLVESMNRIRGDRGTHLDRHLFQPHARPRRSDCGALARGVDLTHLDNVLLHQLENPDLWHALPAHLRDPGTPFYQTELHKVWSEVRCLLGRLLFRNQEFRTLDGRPDRWQLFLFIKGASATGKSTVQKTIIDMVGSAAVGILDCNTFEKQFGLGALIRSDLIAVNEMASNMAVSENTILQMVDGSRMSAPRKNRDPYVGSVRGPLLILGNSAPRSSLNAGQWQRRQMLLPFPRSTDGCRKPNLEASIRQLHLGHATAALHMAYWGWVETRGHQDPWQVRGQGNATEYATFSWFWHEQKRKSECQANNLGKVIATIREASRNQDPPYLMHQDAQRTDRIIHTLRGPWAALVRDTFSLSLDNAPPAVRELFTATDAEPRPTFAYMPFEAIQFPDGDAGPAGSAGPACPGFKAVCKEVLASIQGGAARQGGARGAARQVLPWEDEEDFFGAVFAANHLYVFQGRLPYPPYQSSHLVNSRWIIGITSRDAFSVNGGAVHPAYAELRTRL
ncbi:MAG: DUF5906 domain-containing protein [Pseudomonadota bacterium]